MSASDFGAFNAYITAYILLLWGTTITVLIVFFVMASNVGAIARRSREISDKNSDRERQLSDIRFQLEKIAKLLEGMVKERKAA
jgi:membrane protein implicated in regulation of membrane protease activity